MLSIWLLEVISSKAEQIETRKIFNFEFVFFLKGQVGEHFKMYLTVPRLFATKL